jgi:hypothetical protein
LTSEGMLHVVTELPAGQLLGDLLQQHGPLSLPRALRLAILIGEGLEAAHNTGVTHGRLSINTVLVCSDDSIRVLGLERAGLMPTPGAPPAGVGGAPKTAPAGSGSGDASEHTDICDFAGVVEAMLVGSPPENRAVSAGWSFHPGSSFWARMAWISPRVRRILARARDMQTGGAVPEMGAVVNELALEMVRSEERRSGQRQLLVRVAVPATVVLVLAAGLISFARLSTRAHMSGTSVRERPVALPVAPNRPAIMAPPLVRSGSAVLPASTDEAPPAVPKNDAEVRPAASTSPASASHHTFRRTEAVKAPQLARSPLAARSEGPGSSREHTVRPSKTAAMGVGGQETPAPPPRVGVEDPETPDPSSIIDWLLKEGANQR